jgi:hypothetical protein
MFEEDAGVERTSKWAINCYLPGPSVRNTSCNSIDAESIRKLGPPPQI